MTQPALDLGLDFEIVAPHRQVNAGWHVARTVAFTVSGDPAVQPSKGSALNKTTGRPYSFVRRGPWIQWRADIRHHAEAAMAGQRPMDGPVMLGVRFIRPLPASAPKTKPILPIKEPDLSNLLKCVEDAVQGTLLSNDARIVGFLFLSKEYAYNQPPGVEIEARELEWRGK